MENDITNFWINYFQSGKL